MRRNFLLDYSKTAFKMTKYGVYFTMIALMIAELFKMTCGHKIKYL